MKICLFGSSFNPPHIAHVEIIEELKKQNFDKLLLVPTGKPNHKQIEISNQDRILMTEAIAKQLGVEISLHEIENNFEYTVESLKYLDFAKDDEVYFTIGGDSVNTLKEWDYYQELKAMVTFIVIKRPRIELDQSTLNDINYVLLDLKTTDISSSQLRKNLDSCLIPECVLQIIYEKGLYV